ncbi:type IV pilus modification protein PilV [Thalassotalea sp. 42_200_T64]|mgnify:CR=1 FL=1|nr:type IV pilus modification protein PilV [Thalassotalea sp. 42_200_T64]
MANLTSPHLPILTRAHKFQRGFSLLEVLISMLIITFGMFGVAKLQLNALRDVQNAHYASKAASFATQMAEQITANSTALENYQLAANQQVSASVNCSSTSCSSGNIAKYDLQLWQQKIANALPFGQAEIITTAHTANIIVRWDQNRNGSSGLNCPKKDNKDLECSRISRVVW